MTVLVVKLSEGLARRVAWAADVMKAETHEDVAIAAIEQFTRGLAAVVAQENRRGGDDRRRAPRAGKDRRRG